MLPGVLLVSVQLYLQLRFIYRDIRDLRLRETPEVQQARHELKIWEEAAVKLLDLKDGILLIKKMEEKIKKLKANLQELEMGSTISKEEFEETLKSMEEKVNTNKRKWFKIY